MKKAYLFTSLALLLGLGAAVQGCDKVTDAAGNVAEQCGLKCDETALLEGKATFGVPGIDGFFGAVGNFQAAADATITGINKPMADLKASLLLSADASPADIKAAIMAKYKLNATAGLTIKYAAPQCSVSAKATLDASAKCDATVVPGKVSAKCEGSCQADVKVTGGKASCEGEAKLSCSAPSASIKCDTLCKGDCTLEAAAECTGTCNGTCSGTCSVKNADGSCAGKCEGTCKGTCKLDVAAKCTGTCSGECVAEAQGGSCTGGAKVQCTVEPPKGSASVECKGSCSGSVEPPEVSADCKASVKADAQLKAECTPPSIDVAFEFDAAADATLQAEFKGTFLPQFKSQLAAIVTAAAKADVVAKAGLGIIGSIEGVTAGFQDLAAEGNLKASIGGPCAVLAIVKVAPLITKKSGELKASVSGSVDLVAAFK